MKKYLKLKYILSLLIIVLIVGQFFPIDKTNPPIDLNKDLVATLNPPQAMAQIIKGACYDCHSHEVEYPWYTNVFPISRWIGGHIKNGRNKLNFSAWADYDKNKKIHHLEECAEVLEEKRMPPKSFVFMHTDAQMTDDEKAQLIAWFKTEAAKL